MSKRVSKKSSKPAKPATAHRGAGKNATSPKAEESLNESDLKRVSGGIIRKPVGNHNETFVRER